MQRTQGTLEVDWLLSEREAKGANDACVIALTSVVQIARECCTIPLSLEEAQYLLETVWYEMVPQEED